MFEVQDLKYATLATVTRCGMVWFSQDVLSTEMIFENFLHVLKNCPVEDSEEEGLKALGGPESKEDTISPSMQVGSRIQFCEIIRLKTCTLFQIM